MIVIVILAIGALVLISVAFGYFLGATRNPRNPNE